MHIHSKNAFGCGAVHWAAARGDVAVLRWLYEKGFDMSVVNGASHDALNKAAWRGHTAALDWLLYDESGPKLVPPPGLTYGAK